MINIKSLVAVSLIAISTSTFAGVSINTSDILIHDPSPFINVSGSHWVNGYFRSNGTYVRRYQRTNPDGVCFNNYNGC